MHSVCAVVPAYNAGRSLPLTLDCLREQILPPGVSLQVVVVDDGSSDDSAEILRQQALTWPALSVVSRARDSLSCRARTRNLGLSRVEAELTLFVDATVALPRDWLGAALALSRGPYDLVLGETLGLLPGAAWPSLPPRDTSPMDLPALIRQVRPLPAWEDIRLHYFDAAGSDLPGDSCPWTMGWTSAMLVPTALVRDAGGFDETFMGWGGEDVELSLKLWKAGAAFRVLREPNALHWPHEAEARPDKLRSMIANMAKIFQKYPSLETEVFCSIGHFAGSLVSRLEALPLDCVVPTYQADVLDVLRRELSTSRESLLLGAPLRLAEVLPATCLLSPSTQHERHLRSALPDRQIERRLGLRLPWSTGTIELAVVTDFFGGIPHVLKLAVTLELRRVCRRTIFLCSSAPATEPQGAFAWHCTNEMALTQLIQAAKGRILKTQAINDCRLIEMGSL